MKSLAHLLARFIATFRIEAASADAILCAETVDALAGFYGDGPVPAFEITLIEELFLQRFLAARFEAHLGERGLFVKRGDDPQGALHPAVNAAIRARGRYAKIMRELARLHLAEGGSSAGRGVGPRPPRAANDPSLPAHQRPMPVAPAPNGHAVAPSPVANPAGDGTVAAPFMNRAMRRLAERNVAKHAKRESKPACTV